MHGKVAVAEKKYPVVAGYMYDTCLTYSNEPNWTAGIDRKCLFIVIGYVCFLVSVLAQYLTGLFGPFYVHIDTLTPCSSIHHKIMVEKSFVLMFTLHFTFLCVFIA